VNQPSPLCPAFQLILAKAEQVSVRASMATPLTSDCGGGGDTVGLQVTFTGSASAVHQVSLHTMSGWGLGC